MRNFVDRRKKSFEINRPDFYKAMEHRNFDEMADIYNEMMRYDDLAATNGMDRYFFAEVLDGYVIKLPTNAVSFIRRMENDFYYILTDSYILYDVDEYPVKDGETDVTLNFLKQDNVEVTKAVLAGDTIPFTTTAVKTLNLSVGDIMEITLFDNDCFEICKFERPLSQIYRSE